MAKHKKQATNCKRARVSFKAKGKPITFIARVGAACGPRKYPRLPQMKEIAKAGKACKKQGPIGGHKRTACLKRWFREND